MGLGSLYCLCHYFQIHCHEFEYCYYLNLIIAIICKAILALVKDDKAKLHGSFDDAEETNLEISPTPSWKFKNNLIIYRRTKDGTGSYSSQGLSYAAVFDNRLLLLRRARHLCCPHQVHNSQSSVKLCLQALPLTEPSLSPLSKPSLEGCRR
jgi:hypothetical protein